MSEGMDWIAAAAESEDGGRPLSVRRGRFSLASTAHLPEHSFPGRAQQELIPEDREGRGGDQRNDAVGADSSLAGGSQFSYPIAEDATRVESGAGSELGQVRNPEFDYLNGAMSWEEERERRIYRTRTVRMLRRYMVYSVETGRLPSLLGREFFRTQVTSYSGVTFEDRVIFVHDMETCLSRLDEFSRQLIARHILQEHDQEATARLLECGERTVRTYTPVALDLLSEILLDAGLLERTFPIREKSCQGGKNDDKSVSSSEESKNKFPNFAG